jgi:hypothetical protein
MKLFKLFISITLTGLTLSGQSLAQQNEASDMDLCIIKGVNDGWEFSFEAPDSANSNQVTLSHTWNSEDAFDEEPGYRRTVAWYQKELNMKPSTRLQMFTTNGSHASRHKGGYTAFTGHATTKAVQKQFIIDNNQHSVVFLFIP